MHLVLLEALIGRPELLRIDAREVNPTRIQSLPACRRLWALCVRFLLGVFGLDVRYRLPAEDGLENGGFDHGRWSFCADLLPIRGGETFNLRSFEILTQSTEGFFGGADELSFVAPHGQVLRSREWAQKTAETSGIKMVGGASSLPSLAESSDR